MKSIALKLFVTGQSAYGLQARQNLEKMIHRFEDYQFDIEVLDVLENPDLAAEEKILATPTLIKHQPLPTCRIIGDLSDLERVTRALSLQETPRSGQ